MVAASSRRIGQFDRFYCPRVNRRWLAIVTNSEWVCVYGIVPTGSCGGGELTRAWSMMHDGLADVIVRVRTMANRQARRTGHCCRLTRSSRGPDVSPSRSPTHGLTVRHHPSPAAAESACRPHAAPAGDRHRRQRDPGHGTRETPRRTLVIRTAFSDPAHHMLHSRRQRPWHQTRASRSSL